MGKILEVNNLTKIYCEGSIESKVVDNLSLEVEEGVFAIVMGTSGSGKTSFLHLIAGIDQPDGGKINYLQKGLEDKIDFGHISEKAKTIFRRTNIGIVFQQQCLIPDLTVYENIMLPMMLDRKRKEKNSMKGTVLELCRQFGLIEHTRKYPSQLSGGQQQRAAILRAIVNKPPVLLCDEPTGSLNSAQSDIVMEILESLNQKGQSIILVTHDIKVAIRGSRVIYIEDGHLEGELRFNSDTEKELYKQREVELMSFLQKRGW